MLQALHHILFTPSLPGWSFYVPSVIGFYATTGVLFLLMLILRWVLPPLRRVIPPASREVIMVMACSSTALALAIFFWRSQVERWDLDALWGAGYFVLILFIVHFWVRPSAKQFHL